jgi:hypothetical protein
MIYLILYQWDGASWQLIDQSYRPGAPSLQSAPPYMFAWALNLGTGDWVAIRNY